MRLEHRWSRGAWVLSVLVAALVALGALCTGCAVEKSGVGERCVVGSDCDSDLCLHGVCQQPNRVACADDPYEPNGERDEARRLAVGRSYAGLQLCAGDEDWFELELLGDTRLRLELSPTSSAGPGLMVLRAPDGQPVAAEQTESEAGTQRNVYAVATAGVYSVQVAAGTGGDGGYTLGAWEEQDCADAHADDAAEAGALVEDPGGPFAVEDGTLCPDDEDWWTLGLGPNDGLRVLLSYDGDAEHRLELHGRGEGGALALLAEGVTGEEGVELLYTRPGSLDAEQVLLRVAPGQYLDVEVPYVLRGEVLLNDDSEPGNDTAAGALAADALAVPLPDGEGLELAGVLAPGDEDWLRLGMPAGHLLRIEGSYALGEGVELLAAVVTAAEMSLPGGDAEGSEGTLALQLDPGLGEDGDLLLRLSPELSAGAVAWGSYELVITSIAIEPDCEDDAREAEEPVEVAVERGRDAEVALADGVLCPGDEDVFDVAGLTAGELLGARLELGAPEVGALALDFMQGAVAVAPLERELPDGGTLVAARSPGTLQVRVRWADGAAPGEPQGYELQIVRGGGCADEEASESGAGNDELETPGQAPGDDFEAVACALDPDYLSLEAGVGETLRVTVTTEGREDLSVTLYDSEGGELDRAEGEDREWQVRALAEAPRTELILGVRLLAGAGTTYTVQVERIEAQTIEEIQAQVFTPACSDCHAAGGHPTGLMLSDALTSWGGLVGQSTAAGDAIRVVAGDPGASFLIEKISSDDPSRGDRMPWSAPALSTERIAGIRSWVLAGAAEPGAE